MARRAQPGPITHYRRSGERGGVGANLLSFLVPHPHHGMRRTTCAGGTPSDSQTPPTLRLSDSCQAGRRRRVRRGETHWRLGHAGWPMIITSTRGLQLGQYLVSAVLPCLVLSPDPGGSYCTSCLYQHRGKISPVPQELHLSHTRIPHKAPAQEANVKYSRQRDEPPTRPGSSVGCRQHGGAVTRAVRRGHTKKKFARWGSPGNLLYQSIIRPLNSARFLFFASLVASSGAGMAF